MSTDAPTVRGLIPRVAIAVNALGCDLTPGQVALVVHMFLEGLAGQDEDRPSEWLRTIAAEVQQWEER